MDPLAGVLREHATNPTLRELLAVVENPDFVAGPTSPATVNTRELLP
jgi:hypothetical protein